MSERPGEREIEVALEHGTTGNQMIERFELSDFRGSGLRVAIDGQIGAPLDTPLRDSSEIAFLPPVSGG